MSGGGQTTAQGEYHRELFPAWHDWETTVGRIADFTGESGPSGLLGLDQMGHFGPHGCDRVADAVAAHRPADRAEEPLRLVELGSGFGGALRYLVDALTARGAVVGEAVGVDLVPEHCEVSARITASQGRSNVTEVCASADAVPLPDGEVDAVVVTGSMPHFPDPAAVLREAARLLADGGVLVVTEEVSLCAAGEAPAPAFRRFHPEGVFFLTDVEERRTQFTAAGLDLVAETDVSEWAAQLVAERLRALRLFRGSLDSILGADSADRVVGTLDSALAEYRAERLLPRLFVARKV
ncbi:class I SAM-dependent methyltransferase [Streptomyces capillispiralis]|uniref:Methyltransferase family protein n=1 Tax=Streptomyces capillispiralis TaxID=68182 RepID=A0A561TBX0_9ACTN|nr:class I SAM-dependent methyltransferase [Streptomyces capillispiralis]TWF84611.1 methyltransferase family protein [Streptomyces capillispiralis]GHH95924.1 hypothetical protein GCM10017779_63810 [Streptomyces capillispiralis]